MGQTAFPSTAPRKTKSFGDNDGVGEHSNTYRYTVYTHSQWNVSVTTIITQHVSGAGYFKVWEGEQMHHEFGSLLF